jgi:selenocysteine lyase/cysteine desulfurase
MTPLDSTTPMVACAYKDAYQVIGPRLKEAGIKISVSRNRFRASVSVFNDMADIDKLLAALGTA